MLKISKKIIVLVLTIFLISLPICTFAASNTLPFRDVKENDWYSAPLKYMYSNKYINGTTATTFSPDMKLDRAMLVTILYNMEKNPKVTGVSKFLDVKKPNEWYYSAVIWASKNGIINGYNNGTFAPYKSITREEVAIMLMNYSNYKKSNVKESKSLYSYSDRKKVSSWAEGAVKWAVGNKIINGKNGGTEIDPGGTATRAEAITMIKNYIDAASQRKKPSYTTPRNLTATYGQTLADVKLPAGFSFENSLSTPVGNVGSNTFKVTYTPSDTNTYAIVKGIEVKIKVSRADPKYTVPTGITVTYGQTLANITLPEGFSFQDIPATSVGNPGVNTFKVKYTPQDTNNYNTIRDIPIQITVNSKTYKLNETWTVPNQWTLKFNSVELHSKCNPYASGSGEQVVIIHYTYSNIGYVGSSQGLYINSFDVYDENGSIAERYACTHDGHPADISIGNNCTTSVAYILPRTSSKITVEADEWTSNSTGKQRAKFILDVGSSTVTPTPPTEDTKITIKDTNGGFTSEVAIGDTVQLIATTNSSKTITWSSDKTSVATVNSNGLITAVAPGFATISATVDGKTAKYVISVYAFSNVQIVSSYGNTNTVSIRLKNNTDSDITILGGGAGVTVDNEKYPLVSINGTSNGQVTLSAGETKTITFAPDSIYADMVRFNFQASSLIGFSYRLNGKTYIFGYQNGRQIENIKN